MRTINADYATKEMRCPIRRATETILHLGEAAHTEQFYSPKCLGHQCMAWVYANANEGYCALCQTPGEQSPKEGK